MPGYIHMKHGEASQRERLLEILNKSFEFEKEEEQFLNILPKLYKEKYCPAENNIILDIDGDMRAAVGLFYNELTVAGEKLKAAGIGNVAVLPEYRGESYMRFCMAYALDEVKQNMTDIVYLSGARQRYEHHGFEGMGIKYSIKFDVYNAKSVFGKGFKSSCTLKVLSENDTDVFEKILEKYRSYPFYATRDADSMLDLLKSWRCTPYGVFDENELKGWFAIDRDLENVLEFGYINSDYIKDITSKILELCGKNSINITLAPFDTQAIDFFTNTAESYYMCHSNMYNVLSYENVIRAFLKLKATYTKLCDGEITLLIEGVKLPEQIKITVKDNDVTVVETYDKPDICLKHLDALKLIGATSYSGRNDLPPQVASWFPLPIFTYPQDNV